LWVLFSLLFSKILIFKLFFCSKIQSKIFSTPYSTYLVIYHGKLPINKYIKIYPKLSRSSFMDYKFPKCDSIAAYLAVPINLHLFSFFFYPFYSSAATYYYFYMIISLFLSSSSYWI